MQPRGGRGGRAFLPCPRPAEGRGTSDPEIPRAPPSSPFSDVRPDPPWACLAPRRTLPCSPCGLQSTSFRVRGGQDPVAPAESVM